MGAKEPIVVKLTKAAVERALPGWTWDIELKGFGLRVLPSGTRTYVYQYRMGKGREFPRKRYSIGPHGRWTPDTARTKAKELERAISGGFDPLEADKRERVEAVDLAFDAFVETFSEKYLQKEWGDRWQEAAALLRREAVPVLRSKPLPKVVMADVSAVLDRLADRPAVARQCYAILNRLFRWSVSPRGLIARSPMEGMEPPSSVPSRDRVLKDEELRLVWEATETLHAPLTGFYRMLIVTAARRDEVAGLDWSELDRKAAMWTLPAARAKNDNVHDIPLSEMAVEILDDAAGGTEWPVSGIVFVTPKRTAIAGFSSAKTRLDREVTKLADLRGEQVPAAWRVHDLRRTVATGLQRLGVRFEVTEAVLNHVSGAKGGVAGVYQRHAWADEKRDALNAWAEHIATLVESDETGPRRLNKFQLIANRLLDREGEFEVDAMPHGRAALLAAATAAARAHHHHHQKVDAAKRAERLAKALRDSVDAAERIIAEANLTPAGLLALDMQRVAGEQLANLSMPEKLARGWSGNDIRRQAAEAAAQAWSDATGDSIPRAGIKQRINGERLPLAELLDAVSRDLFGRPGQLSGNYLRGSTAP